MSTSASYLFERQSGNVLAGTIILRREDHREFPIVLTLLKEYQAQFPRIL